MPNRSTWLIDRTLSGVTTQDQCGPGSDSNEGVLCISQSSNITEASPSDCLVSYTGHSLGDVLPLCRDVGGVFYIPNQLGLTWVGCGTKQFDKYYTACLNSAFSFS